MKNQTGLALLAYALPLTFHAVPSIVFVSRTGKFVRNP